MYNLLNNMFLNKVPYVFFYIFITLYLIYLAFYFLSKKRHSVSEYIVIENDNLSQKRYRFFVLIALIIIVIFWSPFIIKQGDTHVKIFDNLDCHIPQTKILAESGKAFSFNTVTKIDNIMNGLSLASYDSGYNLLTLLFIIFEPFVAYVINHLIIRLIAFFGMLLLLKKYYIKEEQFHWIGIGVALCFSLLPFYQAGGISVAGLPLLFYTFLNIRDGRRKLIDYSIIFLFPFYSKFALVGIFIVFSLGILFLIDLIRSKKINIFFLGGIILLGLSYIFTNFHLIYSFINPEYISFRSEISVAPKSFLNSLKDSIYNFLFDRVNVVGAQRLFILFSVIIAFIIALVKRLKIKSILTLSTFLLFFSVLWGFKYSASLMYLQKNVQLINAFNFARFYWFNPFLWYLLFAISLYIISKIKFGRQIVAFLLLFQIVFLFIDYNWELKNKLGRNHKITYSLTYNQFFSQNLYNSIGEYINKPKDEYRVISIGLHPGISQYNGFYTLDNYTDLYSLEYKHKFRKIFENELDKNELLKKGFDSNAKRCFLTVNEIHGNNRLRGLLNSRGITKYDKVKIKNLKLNTSVLKELGGEYIFSAVEIENYAENNLKFELIFTNKKSPWSIFLYKVM